MDMFLVSAVPFDLLFYLGPSGFTHVPNDVKERCIIEIQVENGRVEDECGAPEIVHHACH